MCSYPVASSNVALDSAYCLYQCILRKRKERQFPGSWLLHGNARSLTHLFITSLHLSIFVNPSHERASWQDKSNTIRGLIPHNLFAALSPPLYQVAETFKNCLDTGLVRYYRAASPNQPPSARPDRRTKALTAPVLQAR